MGRAGHESDTVELVLDYPSRIAGMLLNDEIDLGLVPVAIIPRIKRIVYHQPIIVSARKRSSLGLPVQRCAAGEVKEVLLDYQSRNFLCGWPNCCSKNIGKVNPILNDAAADFRDHIKGTTAAWLSATGLLAAPARHVGRL